MSRAEAAGLGGVWVAWLSDGQISPSTRFDTSFAGAYVLLDGTIVAKKWVGLTTPPLLHAIDMDEMTMTQSQAPVWTATLESGVSSDSHCVGWMSSSAEQAATVGAADAAVTNGSWTQGDSLPCDQKARLYCFEQ